jgi:arylsulfatase A-like enzyme
MKRPNVLFLFSDQQRWDTLGCYGELGWSLDLTPNLDRLAAEGVRFEYAFTPQPVCGPTRAVLQTGQYATQVGVPTNHCVPTPGSMQLAPAMKAAGYQTAYIGKWHLASCGRGGDENDFVATPVPPERRGGYEDYWLASDVLEFTSHGHDGHMWDGAGNRREFPEGQFRAAVQADWTCEYLREHRDPDKPFFLMVSWIEPHHQNDHECFEGPHGSKERFAEYPVPGDLEGLEGDWQKEMPDYLGCCGALDDAVGKIRATLDELGIADDTIIIYTSDHGCHFCTRNSEYKRACEDSCLRVPMVIAGPGVPAGTVVEDLVSLIDIPPTILHAGGATIPDAFQGNPMQCLWDGSDASDWQDDIYAQISESHCGRTVRTKRWKYAVAAENAHALDLYDTVYRESFLYDLDADPWERDNLVSDPSLADVRSELRGRLLARMKQAGEPDATILPAD